MMKCTRKVGYSAMTVIVESIKYMVLQIQGRIWSIRMNIGVLIVFGEEEGKSADYSAKTVGAEDLQRTNLLE
eukprot:193866-Ditylum_brightwellii.AAC.1